MEIGSRVTGVTPKGVAIRGTFNGAAKGWTAVIAKDGKQIKVRNGTVKAQSPTEKDDGSPILNPDIAKYHKHETKTAAGRHHFDINDDVAKKLREMALADVYKYAGELLEESVSALKQKYQHLNNGMQRMNLGNRIRAVYRLANETKNGFSKHKEAA